MQFDVLQADSTGHFLVERISFRENTGFIVQARNSKGRKGVEVIIDSEVYLAPEIQIPYERRQANGEDEFYKQFGRDFYYDHGVKVYVLDEALVRRTPPKKNYSFYDASARYMLDSARLLSLIHIFRSRRSGLGSGGGNECIRTDPLIRFPVGPP